MNVNYIMDGVELDQFALYATLLLAFFVCLVYLGVGLRVLREDAMGNKITQFYGYSVCLVAIIAFLVSAGSLAGAIVEWSDPLHAVGEFIGYPQRSLASFETYKMDVLNPPFAGERAAAAPRYTPDEDTLRRMYEAARTERIQAVRLRLRRSVVTNVFVIALGAALFGIHWRWLKRLAGS